MTTRTFCRLLPYIFALLAFPGCLLSQTYDITSSQFEFNSGSTTMQKIIGHDPESFYGLKHYSNQYYLEKLDASLNLVREESINLFEGLKSYELEALVHFHGELYLFVSRRKFSESVLYYQRIDKNSLKPLEGLIEIANIQFINGNWPDFHFALSRRESKFTIAALIKLNWIRVQHNELFMFGKGMEMLWRRKDFIEFKGQGPRENVFVPDEKGNLSVLSLTKEESIISLFRDIKNAYTIYRYTDEGQTYREYPVIFENRYIRGIKILGSDNGELICSGLYSELYRAGVGGTFFFKIDASGGLIYNNQSYAFSNDLLMRLSDFKEPVLAREELIQYKLTDLVPRRNGNIVMITEQIFEQPYNTYNNLIVICFDSTGQVNWNQVIPKRQDFDVQYLQQQQVEVGEYRNMVRESGLIDANIENYCSYALIAPQDGDDIILLYNDHIRNTTRGDKLKGFGHPKKSYLASAHINAFGTLTYGEVLKWKRKLLYPEPMRYYDTLGNTIIIPAYKSRKYNYYKITARF
jgi:hypothetical protein